MVLMFVVIVSERAAAPLADACAMPTMQIVDVNFPFNVEICLSTGFLMHSSSYTHWQARKAASHTSPNLIGAATA